jgi:hypothetical protein
MLKIIGATSESVENFEKTSFFEKFCKMLKITWFSQNKTLELRFQLKQHVPHTYSTAKCSLCS